mmetsp:Transcript_17924/g.49725  ORF Transcript_17924/g.49725 Transcript_17924/m.49725 type:complete len:201 (-) Transcript_17924:619-1221(-)
MSPAQASNLRIDGVATSQNSRPSCCSGRPTHCHRATATFAMHPCRISSTSAIFRGGISRRPCCRSIMAISARRGRRRRSRRDRTTPTKSRRLPAAWRITTTWITFHIRWRSSTDVGRCGATFRMPLGSSSSVPRSSTSSWITPLSAGAWRRCCSTTIFPCCANERRTTSSSRSRRIGTCCWSSPDRTSSSKQRATTTWPT